MGEMDTHTEVSEEEKSRRRETGEEGRISFSDRFSSRAGRTYEIFKRAKKGDSLGENVAFLLAAVFIMVCVVASAFLSSPSQGVQDVVISDDTNIVEVVNKGTLMGDLTQMSSYQDVNVLIHIRESMPGDDSDDHKEATLNYLRENTPESVVEDEVADDWFVVSLSLEWSIEEDMSSQVEVFFGENVQVSSHEYDAIKDAGTQDFNNGEWSDGIVKVADKATSSIGKPFYADTLLLMVGAGVLFLVICAAFTWVKFVRGSRNLLVERIGGITKRVKKGNVVLSQRNSEKGGIISDDVLMMHSHLLEDRKTLERLQWFQLGLVGYSHVREVSKRVDAFEQNTETQNVDGLGDER